MNSRVRTIVLVLLILLLLGVFPAWPWSAGWGYYPVGGTGMLFVVIVIVLLVT